MPKVRESIINYKEYFWQHKTNIYSNIKANLSNLKGKQNQQVFYAFENNEVVDEILEQLRGSDLDAIVDKITIAFLDYKMKNQDKPDLIKTTYKTKRYKSEAYRRRHLENEAYQEEVNLKWRFYALLNGYVLWGLEPAHI